MDAVSGLQYAKHKSVYGKKSARGYNTTNINSFFDEDEDELASTQPAVARQPSVKTTYPVKKTEAKPPGRGLKPVKPRIKRQDTFDVPSSSDDESSLPAKRVAPLKWRSALVDDTDTSGAQLARREDKKQEASQSSRSAHAKRLRTPEGSPEAQLKQELRQATLSPESTPRTPKSNPSVSPRGSTVTSPNTGSESGITSAKAQLAARRKLVESNVPSSADERSKPSRALPKRSVFAGDESESTPRKRARTVATTEESTEDVHMADADEDVVCDIKHQQQHIPANDTNIYDFPESSEDELKHSKATIKSPKALSKPSRRGKLPTYKPRSLHTKGSSAPSRLAEMIATDTDTTAPSTRSPSESPSLISAQQTPSTPPSGRVGSPVTAIKSTGTMTPKQAQLWHRLLPSDPVAPSPSALAMKDLTISGRRRDAVPPAVGKLAKSQSDVPRRRLRMVDRLKASAPSSDNESSDEESEDADMADEEASVDNIGPVHNFSSTAKNAPPQLSRSQSQTESQSQTQPITSKGSLKTYANVVRSHLDDSIDEIMFGLTDEPSKGAQPASQLSKRQASMSQQSAFDLDESDDDGVGNGGIRTIHELRAAGSHTRGMWDIDEALEDITQHALTQRGRRRTALIDLATKLGDKTFVSRFFGQSCELRLAAECGACPDEVADFILAAAMSLLLASDPPDHIVQSLHGQGVVTWLAKILDQDTPINKLAKDRRNNMSKASQSSLLEFSDMLSNQSTLWNENRPQVMSPRLIALKGLDQFTRRLRRLGDKSELLQGDELGKVLRDSGEAGEHSNQIDLALSISLLESLSTASLSLRWPTSVLENVRSLLPRLKTSSPSLRHVQFLTLRLCLNLTNDNERNCALLTGSPSPSTVHFLLGAIQSGYTQLATESDDEKRTVALDLLVLAIGITINLAEHSNEARSLAVADAASLAALVEVFQLGQKHMLDAESVEESISNVTFGYLAVMLANLCQNLDARAFIAARLPGRNLGMLIEAVEEFVRHHQKVDTMNFDGEEGREVWGAFTEKLRVVLSRLKEVEHGSSGLV